VSALLLSCVTLCASFQGTAREARPPADLVVRGRIFTCAAAPATAEALAVHGTTITALGTRAESERWLGPATRVLDVGEGSVVPGFDDAHCHFTVATGMARGIELAGADSLAAILERVHAYATAHPELEVLTGSSWDLADMPGDAYPTRAALDEVVSERPVLLWSEGPHAVWANSMALERAKLDGKSSFAPGVVALKDPEGELTGVFLGRGLFGLFPFEGLPDEAAFEAGIRAGLREAARLGVTTVQDPVEPFLLPFLAELCDAGELTLRFHVWGQLLAGPFGGGPAAARALEKEHARPDWITFGTLKGGVDGMPSLRTAALLAPYADDPATRGSPLPPAERLAAAVRAAHAAGLRVALHATGDAGVRAALDSFVAEPRTGLRDRVEHAFLVDPADVPRLAASGTLVSVQMGFLARDLAQGAVYERRFGVERCKTVLPLRALVDAGVTLAFGTDFSLNPLDPRVGLAAAVGRQDAAGAPAAGWHPEQRLTLAEALRAYTLGSATAEGAEARKGTLEPGKLADLVLFERDLFALAPGELVHDEVVATVVGGRVVYAR